MKALLAFALALTACSKADDFTHQNDPPTTAPYLQAIRFDIVQTPDHTTASWARVEETSSSVLARSERCVLEALDSRTVSQASSGSATFSGAQLGTGLTIVPGQDSPRTTTGAWTTGDLLTFTSTGFDAPTIPPAQIEAPSTFLKVLVDDGPLTVTTTKDFDAHWAPGVGDREDSILVSFLTTGNVELRCTYSRGDIHGFVPKDMLARLGSTTGTLSWGTRRGDIGGTSTFAIYVNATAVLRQQPFTLTN